MTEVKAGLIMCNGSITEMGVIAKNVPNLNMILEIRLSIRLGFKCYEMNIETGTKLRN